MAATLQTITIRGGKGAIDEFSLHVNSCNVSSRARMSKHPIETGQTIFDNKVLDPRTITIQADVYATDGDTKRKLREMWRNRTYQFYSIMTREAFYKNFSCTECSHVENTEKIDMLTYTIRFEEVMKAQSRQNARSTDDENAVG